MRPLGRRIPTDWSHVEKYPLRALRAAPARGSVVLGINWYSNFDKPVKVGGYWMIGRGDLGVGRGGHAIAAEPGGKGDVWQWRLFYDQKDTNACTGASAARCLTIFNRRQYKWRWIWDRAKELDEWPDTNPGDNEGSSVSAAMEALRTLGAVRYDAIGDQPLLADGIVAYRWATSVDEVHATLQNPRADKLGAIPLLNSWGRDYPQRVWLVDETLDRLIQEEGEVAVVTDR